MGRTNNQLIYAIVDRGEYKRNESIGIYLPDQRLDEWWHTLIPYDTELKVWFNKSFERIGCCGESAVKLTITNDRFWPSLPIDTFRLRNATRFDESRSIIISDPQKILSCARYFDYNVWTAHKHPYDCARIKWKRRYP